MSTPLGHVLRGADIDRDGKREQAAAMPWSDRGAVGHPDPLGPALK